MERGDERCKLNRNLLRRMREEQCRQGSRDSIPNRVDQSDDPLQGKSTQAQPIIRRGWEENSLTSHRYGEDWIGLIRTEVGERFRN